MYNTCKINDNLYLGKPFLLDLSLLVSLSLSLFSCSKGFGRKFSIFIRNDIKV